MAMFAYGMNHLVGSGPIVRLFLRIIFWLLIT